MNHKRNVLLAMLTVLGIVAVLEGCASKMQLVYQPANETPGQGTVGIRGFTYVPAEKGEVKPDQSQVVGLAMKGETYTETVSDFFERALQLELQKSGFEISGVSGRNITGRIEAFGLDHTPKGNRIDATVQVNFVVSQPGQDDFEYLSTASKEYRNVVGGKLPKDMLIELTGQCISKFLAEAHTQNRL